MTQEQENTVSGTRDTLTGLTDRHAFLKLLRRDSIRVLSSGGLMALLIVNLEQFRRVNSVFGIRKGDRVLTRVGEILRQIGRRHDMVARIGDDEFALLLPGIMNEGHAVLAANKIRRELDLPLQIEGEKIPVQATVGIALCPTHSSHAETLLKHAEFALLKARRAGAGYLVAEPVRTLEIADSWDLEIELETAVENEELELYYQPQVNLSDRRVLRAEALMRWNSPSRGLLRPGVFIPVAERTGRINSLTQWALNTALRQVAECREDLGRAVEVAVNMPANAFQNPQLGELVGSVMKIWGAREGILTIEITESLAMADPETAFAVLKGLRELGARTAIDDFGTGYSSLAYFRDIPADELKIDKVFVKRMADSEEDKALIQTMVDLGHRFGLQVVAEGVEDVVSLDTLARIGCDMAQGNLVAEPLPFDRFREWMKENGDEWRAPPGRAAGRATPDDES